jgi:hypothetical protein
VHRDEVEFSIEEFQSQTLKLIYELAKAGDMFMYEAAGPSSVVVMAANQVKRLPKELQKPKPSICKSEKDLPRVLGISAKDIKPARPKPASKGKKYEWSKNHTNHSGRGNLGGLREVRDERRIYVELKPDETPNLLDQRFHQFVRAQKKKAGLVEPMGGGVGYAAPCWMLRDPKGKVYFCFEVTGYSWRKNTDHLIPVFVESWIKILNDFARHTSRSIGSIVDSKKFAITGGKTHLLSTCESRQVHPDEGLWDEDAVEAGDD